MSPIKINIVDLKNIVSKLNLAIEKTKINPKAGWIELEILSEKQMSLKVANFDYYIDAKIPIDCTSFDELNHLHVTISADTFVPLVSKLEDQFVYISSGYNCIIFTTDTNEYTFPIITELGKVKCVDRLVYSPISGDNSFKLSGQELNSIAESNSRGLVDTIISREIQQFIYVDTLGAITFTENIYINTFNTVNKENELTPYTKFLVNCTQAKLLKIFEQFNSVKIDVELFSEESSKKVRFTTSENNIYIEMIFVVQSDELTDCFPSIRLRAIADKVRDVHAILDKKTLDKALSRLMVFDKKFDITVLDYSKLVFSSNGLKMISVKNKNYEKVDYIKSENTFDYEAVIRFADLVAQLKAIKTKEIDISYGDSAIVINSGNLKQLIPENKVERV